LLVMISAAPGRVTSCQGYPLHAWTFTWRRCPIALHARRQLATKAPAGRQAQHAIEASLRYRTSRWVSGQETNPTAPGDALYRQRRTPRSLVAALFWSLARRDLRRSR